MKPRCQAKVVGADNGAQTAPDPVPVVGLAHIPRGDKSEHRRAGQLPARGIKPPGIDKKKPAWFRLSSVANAEEMCAFPQDAAARQAHRPVGLGRGFPERAQLPVWRS